MSKHHGVNVIERKWYGHRSDTKDARDFMFTPSAVSDLPTLVDLRADCPPVMDQGQLGSCTAHGIIGALRYLLVRSGGPRDHRLSRLQLYYDERVVEGSVSEDSGAEIRDGIKCAAKIGVAHETMWPYIITKFARRPTDRVYKDAIKFEALKYERVAVDPAYVKAALASGYPVIVGFSVYESFESDAVAATGMVPQPDLRNEQMIGGHCVYAVGYGQHPGTITCRNSWANDWGDNGDFYIPEQYICSTQFASDFWIVTAAGLATA